MQHDVLELIETSAPHTMLDGIIEAYLASIGETESARGESYEETAERLDDDVMRAAAARWWQI